MKTWIFTFVLFYFLSAPFVFAEQRPDKDAVKLSWTYPTKETNHIYKIYVSTNALSSKIVSFELDRTLSGKYTNAVVYFKEGAPIRIYMTVSNVWGETIFLRTKYEENPKISVK